MARTKQTARKSTLGMAPRRQLATMASRYDAQQTAAAGSSGDESVEYLRTTPGFHSSKKQHDVFGYDKWPFGGKGEPQEVVSPSGDGCKQISNLLARSDENAGEFSFGGQADMLPAVPGLFVKEVGDVSVPLCPEQAEKLVAKCDKSPFGRKLDTMMDENVRKSWQLAPDQVEIKNPLWQTGMDKLSETVAGRLGYKGVPMQCKLYKLLVYGEGGHFVKHQDTEKEDGMVATMVVQLPSVHEGGDLVVYRGGEVKYRHDFGKKEGTAAYLPHYAVHYADAEHALETVTKGYRLVLIYSICLPPTMRHLMRNQNETLGEELGAVINGMESEEGSFALLLAHEYTGKSVEELGSGALKGVDRARFLTLREANDFAAPGKKLQFFIAQLKHNIHYWDDGGSWVESDRDQSITWYSPSGKKLGCCPGTKIKLNLLNPGKETLSELWTPHGNSTFEGYLGNEGATKDTTYSRYAVIAWPAIRGVENAFQFISVDAAIEALETRRPVDSATLRTFMSDVSAQLAKQKASYSWLRSSTVSVGFCRAMCELLVETADASLVNLFLKDFMSNLDEFERKDEFAAALAVLARNFDWCDIGQALLGSLNKTDAASDNDVDLGSGDDKVVEETDDSRLRIALGIVDQLDAGAAQQALLKTAVKIAAKLSQASLCSSKSVGLLCKWAIQYGDKSIFDIVAHKFEQTKPNLLKPVIDALLKSAGCIGASDERLSGVASIATKRIEWLKSQLEALGKPFSWEMPEAYFPDNARVQAFLRGPSESMSTTGVRHFNGVGHARNYANKWMREKQINASFKLEPDGRGQGAYVIITKTRKWFAQHQKDLLAYKSELRLLLERFEKASDAAPRKRARLE